MLSHLKYSPILYGAVLSTAYLLYGIFTSDSSTAAIGFIFIPVAALIGAVLGGLIEHIYLLIQKKRELRTKLSGFYAIALILCFMYVVKDFKEKRDLKSAGDPNTSVTELRDLLSRRDSKLQRTLLSNSSLPQDEARTYFEANKTKYDVASDIIHGPHLDSGMISEMVKFIPEDFAAKVEYELYQTFVWAPLVRMKRVTPEQIHLLAAKPNPQHFLILALIGSNELTCEEKKKFLPQENIVLENAITTSMTQSGCP